MVVLNFLFTTAVLTYLGYALSSMAFSTIKNKKNIFFAPWIGLALIIVLSINLAIGKAPAHIHTSIILSIGMIALFYAGITKSLERIDLPYIRSLFISFVIFSVIAIVGSSMIHPDMTAQIPVRSVFENTINPISFLIQFFSFLHIESFVFQKILIVCLVVCTAIIIDSLIEQSIKNVWWRRLISICIAFGSSLILTRMQASLTVILGIYFGFAYCSLAWMVKDLSVKLSQLVFALFLSVLVTCSVWLAFVAIIMHGLIIYRKRNRHDYGAFITILVILCVLNPFLISLAFNP